jgi:hypothetical protein
VETGIVLLGIIGVVVNVSRDTTESTRTTIATATVGNKPAIM